MLYNLGLYNHNCGRDVAVASVPSPTLSVLPEVPLEFLRRGKEDMFSQNQKQHKKTFPLMFVLLDTHLFSQMHLN